MSTHKLAYVRVAYKSFSRSARHLLLLIATHQSIETGWAYLSYVCLSEESGLTPRRVMQLVANLEAAGVLEVRRGHGRGHVNFYRLLREEDGLPVPHRPSKKKVQSGEGEKVKFPTPPTEEKVKSETGKLLELQETTPDKVVTTKEREKKALAPSGTVALSFAEKPERQNPFWCEAHEFCHSERLPDNLPGCAREG